MVDPVSEKPVAPAANTGETIPVTESGQAGAEVADAGQTVEEQIKYWREQALTNKGAKEELNRLREQHQQGDAARGAPPAVPPAGDPTQAQIADLEQLLAAARAEYQQYGNASAALSVRNFEMQINYARESWLDRQLLRIPEADRPDVEKALRERRYADADAALDAVQGRKAKAQLEPLRKRVQELETAEEQRKQGVVGTGRPIPVPASQVKSVPKSITELTQELDRLDVADSASQAQRAELSARYRRGDFGVLPP